MALLSDTNPDSTPRSTLCCDSTVGAYKHSNPEKKGKKERRELKTERGGRDFMYTFNTGVLSSGCKRNLFGFVSPLGSVFDGKTLSRLKSSAGKERRIQSACMYFTWKGLVSLPLLFSAEITRKFLS